MGTTEQLSPVRVPHRRTPLAECAVQDSTPTLKPPRVSAHLALKDFSPKTQARVPTTATNAMYARPVSTKRRNAPQSWLPSAKTARLASSLGRRMPMSAKSVATESTQTLQE